MTGIDERSDKHARSCYLFYVKPFFGTFFLITNGRFERLSLVEQLGVAKHTITTFAERILLYYICLCGPHTGSMHVLYRFIFYYFRADNESKKLKKTKKKKIKIINRSRETIIKKRRTFLLHYVALRIQSARARSRAPTLTYLNVRVNKSRGTRSFRVRLAIRDMPGPCTRSGKIHVRNENGPSRFVRSSRAAARNQRTGTPRWRTSIAHDHVENDGRYKCTCRVVPVSACSRLPGLGRRSYGFVVIRSQE